MACLILVVDLFVGEARRHWTYALTLLTLGVAALITVTGSTHVGTTLNGMFVQDAMAQVLKVFICISVAAMLDLQPRLYARIRGLFRVEFFVLCLFCYARHDGDGVRQSFPDVVSGPRADELEPVLVGRAVARFGYRDRGGDEIFRARSARLRHAAVWVVDDLWRHRQPADRRGGEPDRIPAGRRHSAVFGLVFVVAGLGFKLGAVPFHMWVPDVYQGAPTAVTLLIGSAPELAAFAFVLRMLAQALGAQTLVVEWQQMLILLAVLSMAIGNVTAIAQTNIKRMLAYSTISHMGFMLLGILSGSVNGYSSAMFYMITYVLTVVAAFAVIMLLSREGFEADSSDDFKGLNQRNPWYAFIMLLVMFSLAGIPPVVGFYAKLSVFQAVIGAGMTWLAVVAVLFSLMGAFYYLRVVKLMYFDAPEDHARLVSTADVRALSASTG